MPKLHGFLKLSGATHVVNKVFSNKLPWNLELLEDELTSFYNWSADYAIDTAISIVGRTVHPLSDFSLRSDTPLAYALLVFSNFVNLTARFEGVLDCIRHDPDYYSGDLGESTAKSLGRAFTSYIQWNKTTDQDLWANLHSFARVKIIEALRTSNEQIIEQYIAVCKQMVNSIRNANPELVNVFKLVELVSVMRFVSGRSVHPTLEQTYTPIFEQGVLNRWTESLPASLIQEGDNKIRLDGDFFGADLCIVSLANALEFVDLYNVIIGEDPYE